MRFIIIDGLDAAGKDTHARLIKEKYSNNGEEVVVRSHPCSDNLFGIKAEEALRGKGSSARVKATLYFTLDVINSFLKVDKNVDTLIFVRYLCSVAYLPEPLVPKSYKLLSTLFPTSTYKFFLDVEPEEAMERLKDREERQIFENKKDLKKVRKRALSITDEWHVIDTSRPIEEAQEEIEKILDSR
ncbi:MAG: thymidylate kinase [Candidatus Thermoplasmatota archaeon]|nr:thymidylate kinase [Candidatus Thermoplasmatota archaeon]MBS3790046.1 thymidylate kinase [Candidatus Thermoplasmatota archaeon]